MTENIAAM